MSTSRTESAFQNAANSSGNETIVASFVRLVSSLALVVAFFFLDSEIIILK